MKPISFIQKLTMCLIVGLLGGQTFLRASDFVVGKVLPPITLIIAAVLILLGCLAYIGIWQWRHKKGRAHNARIKTFWIGAIRYVLAFDLALFAFQKMMQMERFLPLGVIDEPFSSISGSWLTWSYFGHSHALMITVGLLQLLGALLLVIHRTRLAGVLVLIPIMFTILMIEYFYDFEMGDLIHAATVMVALVYLLALDYQRLVAFFTSYTDGEFSFQTKHTLIKQVGRMSIVFIPVLMIVLKPSPDKHPELTGKYTVTTMSINGEPKKQITTTCDSLLTVVYFDIANDCVFEFNGVRRRMYGQYTLDAAGTIKTQWHYPYAAKEKSFSGRVTRISKGEVELVGHFQKDSVRVMLKKER